MKVNDGYWYLIPVALILGKLGSRYSIIGGILVVSTFFVFYYYYLKCKRSLIVPKKVTKCLLVFMVNFVLFCIAESLHWVTNNHVVLTLAEIWTSVVFWVVAYLCVMIGIDEGLNFYSKGNDLEKIKKLKRAKFYFQITKYMYILACIRILVKYFGII